jgi:hypothetical protein
MTATLTLPGTSRTTTLSKAVHVALSTGLWSRAAHRAAHDDPTPENVATAHQAAERLRDRITDLVWCTDKTRQDIFEILNDAVRAMPRGYSNPTPYRVRKVAALLAA